MNTLERIAHAAKSNPKRIVLPEACDPRIIEAASSVIREGLAEVVLIGDEAKISRIANANKLNLDGIEIEDPEYSGNTAKYIDVLWRKRKHRGLTEDHAKQIISDPLTFAAIKVSNGDASGFVAGAVHTTSDVVKAALQLIGMNPGCGLASSFFLMQHDLPHQAIQGTVIYADCALVIEPDADQLAEIAIASADSARSLAGVNPKVALLSFSTAGSAHHPNVDKVIKAGEIVAQKRPDIELMTEVQFDSAILPDILKRKAPEIQVAAPANVFIFPELQSANIGYKIAQRIGGVKAVGPILQGLKQPVNDLSRGCSVEDIVQLIAVTSVQAGS
jgi:phosphate acetyltransferase